MGENLLETLLGIVDTALVAHLGASATAGVGSAQQIMWFLLGALSALSIGSSVLVVQAIGAVVLVPARHRLRSRRNHTGRPEHWRTLHR
jgi:MATE family multidrug resistance protein